MSEFDINQKVAEQICRDYCWKGRTFKLGEYVALLDGHVVVVADNLADALNGLRAIDPNPSRGMIVEVGPPVVDVVR